jgi:alkylresorcinol/alkylpyrone synthase
MQNSHAFIISLGFVSDMQINQLSTALPSNEYSTQKLIEEFPCELPEPIVQNVLNLGVCKRCLISQSGLTTEPETLMDETSLINLCSEACHKAIQEADLSSGDIDYLITAYDTNPFLSPGLSQLLVSQLDLDPFVRHVNAQGIASTAFLKTLQLAEDHLAMRPKDNVLICISGVSSYWFQNQVRGLKDVMEIGKIGSISDRKRKQMELRKWVATMEFFLFGDGVAAAVVSNRGEELKVDEIVEVTNIDSKDYLAGYARLSFLNEPFKFGFLSHLAKEIPDLGVKYTSLVLEKLFGKEAKNRMKAAKKWAVHTGSEKILDALAEHYGTDKEKLRESHEVLRENGNLAGASLPFILDRIVSANKFARGDTILMLGYGWGFSASAGLLESCL